MVANAAGERHAARRLLGRAGGQVQVEDLWRLRRDQVARLRLRKVSKKGTFKVSRNILTVDNKKIGAETVTGRFAPSRGRFPG
jgi:hypothetical protein